MPGNLWLQALIFSGVAIGGIVLIAWWLYVSPVKQAGRRAQPASRFVASAMALMIGVAAILIVIGGYWDASEHVVTGIVPGGDDFLWPPHLMIYGSFLLALIVAVAGLLALAIPNWKAGVRDPRLWVRRNPYVGAAALAAGYGLLSVPGDAIWHLLFGIDLTAWSPPHIFIALASAAMPLCAIGLLLQTLRGPLVVPSRSSISILLLLALALHITVLIGTLEWEFRGIARLIAERPLWLYPTITGALAFFVLILGRRLVPGPWTATTLALFYFASRLGVSAFVTSISGDAPRLTLVFILGALLLDLAAQRIQATGWRRVFVQAGAFTLGFAAVALPTIEFYLKPFFPWLTPMDHVMTVLATFVVCVIFHRLAEGAGAWLSPNQIEQQDAASTIAVPVGD